MIVQFLGPIYLNLVQDDFYYMWLLTEIFNLKYTA